MQRYEPIRRSRFEYDFVEMLRKFDYKPKFNNTRPRSNSVPRPSSNTEAYSLEFSKYYYNRYLHNRDFESTRPYSFTRVYGNTSTYTPPMLTAETRRLTQRRNYTGYTYIGAEHSYDVSSRPYSLKNYNFWRSHIASSPWYWSYYGNSGLRHYNSYRPRTFTSRLSTYWMPYF